MDNLDSQTYETFEKDPVKYILYEKVSDHTALAAWLYCFVAKAITEALKGHSETKADVHV